MLADVLLGVLVLGRDAHGVLFFVDYEPYAELVTGLQVHVLPEIGEVLTFLLRHVITVRAACLQDGVLPLVGAGPVAVDLPDGVADVVVVLDGVLGLLTDAVGVPVARPTFSNRG